MNKNNIPKSVHQIVAASMAGDITGPAYDIRQQDNCSIQLNFTGAPVGTFNIQGSLDYYPDTNSAGNWIAVTFATPPVASGSAGQILLDMNQLSFPWIRIMYSRTSGTGTLDAYISTKVV